MTSFSGVCFNLRCFRFYAFVKVEVLRSIILRYALPDFFFFFFFPCSADHEQDWPRCKVVFFELATNALNVRNNNNNNMLQASR